MSENDVRIYFFVTLMFTLLYGPSSRMISVLPNGFIPVTKYRLKMIIRSVLTGHRKIV